MRSHIVLQIYFLPCFETLALHADLFPAMLRSTLLHADSVVELEIVYCQQCMIEFSKLPTNGATIHTIKL